MKHMLTVEWHSFDYKDKGRFPRPPHDELCWIVEEFYSPGEASIGHYDGFTWRTWGGSDDCMVSHWAEIVYPEVPER